MKNKTEYWNTVFSFVKKNFENGKYNDDPCSLYAIEVVINESILTSKYVKYMCMQHLLFLYKEATQNDFPYTYKKKPLKMLVAFSQNIIVPEINKPFIFPEFRKFMAGYIWGWRYKNDIEKLMVQEIFDIEARKQWKSSFWSMIILAVLCGFNNDHFAEIYISGPQRETSKIPYTTACNYLLKSPKLQPYFSTFNSLHIKGKNGGIVKHLSFEKSAIEGKNPSIVILTEYHLHPNDEMQESAVTARNSSRKNQLIIYDTTKGHSIDSVCYEREQLYKKFLQNQIEEPWELNKNCDIFLWCAELDEEDYDNWRDSNLWVKANPNLGVSVSLDQLISEYNKIDSKQSEIEFQTKRLGMWVGEANAYFSIFDLVESDKQSWEKIKDIVKNVNMLKNFNPIVGIDLSTIHDTTHAVLAFEIPQDDGESILYFIGKGFIPSDNALKKEFNDKARYHLWQDNYWCKMTPGKVIDYDYLIEQVKEWKKIYNINKIGYDPWQFNIVKQIFLNSSMFIEEDLVAISQGTKLSPFFKEFERKLKLKKVCFGGNQMLIDQITNVSVKHLNSSSENLLIQKISQNQRIDGFMALLNTMAIRVDNPLKTNPIGFVGINLNGSGYKN